MLKKNIFILLFNSIFLFSYGQSEIEFEEKEVINDILSQIEYVNMNLAYRLHRNLFPKEYDSTFNSKNILEKALKENTIFSKQNKDSNNYFLILGDSLYKLPSMKYNSCLNDTNEIPSYYPIESFKKQTKSKCRIIKDDLTISKTFDIIFSSEDNVNGESRIGICIANIHISRIYFDSSKKYALLDYFMGPHRGLGARNMMLLEKIDDHWIIKNSILTGLF